VLKKMGKWGKIFNYGLIFCLIVRNYGKYTTIEADDGGGIAGIDRADGAGLRVGADGARAWEGDFF